MIQGRLGFRSVPHLKSCFTSLTPNKVALPLRSTLPPLIAPSVEPSAKTNWYVTGCTIRAQAVTFTVSPYKPTIDALILHVGAIVIAGATVVVPTGVGVATAAPLDNTVTDGPPICATTLSNRCPEAVTTFIRTCIACRPFRDGTTHTRHVLGSLNP